MNTDNSHGNGNGNGNNTRLASEPAKWGRLGGMDWEGMTTTTATNKGPDASGNS